MKHLLSIAMLAWASMVGAQSYTYNYSSECKNTSWAYLGIESCDVSTSKADLLGFDNQYGSYITSVNEGSSAARAGLQPFDYVFGIDDNRTNRRNDLTDLLNEYEPGEEVTVHFIRKGQERSEKVLLGSPGDRLSYDAANDPHLGVSLTGNHDLKDDRGVRVMVSNNTTAEEMGLEDKDIITAINGFPIVDWTDVSTAINMLTPGDMIEITYERNGEPAQAAAPIQSVAASKPVIETSNSCCAFIGVNLSQISREKARKLGFDNQYGLYVTGVIPGTAAEKAGVEPFDYIYGIDEYRVGADQSMGYILRKYEPGDDAKLHIVRKGQRQTLPITLGSEKDKEQVYKGECEEPFFGIRQNHTISTDEGIPVSIVSNSTAQAMGMEDDDIIVKINDYPMIDWTDISTAIDNMQVGAPIKVEYLRDGRRRTDTHPIKSHCDTQNKANAIIQNGTWNIRSGDENVVIERMDLSNIQIQMEDVSRRDVELLQERYGVNFQATNNLLAQRLIVTPRPNMGTFNIQFSLPQRGDTSIRIFNDTGRLIYDYELNNFSGAFSDHVNISQNGEGAYFLQIRQGNKQMSKKIILEKA